MNIIYNAIFEYADDGINITFPDIPEAFTCAHTFEESIKMAKGVLEITLHKKKYDNLPKCTKKDNISVKYNTEIVEIKISMEIRDGILYGNDIIEFT